MTLALTQNATAIIPGMTASFLAAGGTAPYVYSVLAGGAGGNINASTGAYVAPVAMGITPATLYDNIRVTDNVAATATAQILVGNALLLFCEILQQEMGLAAGRVFLWDQKIFQPADNDLYIAVGVASCKPFGNVNAQSANGLNAEQFVAMFSTLSVDVISRGPSARDRKEEVLLALASNYSQYQQTANSFLIGRVPASGGFINLSSMDGAAIPYRFRISINIQYAFSKTKAVPYFGTFTNPPTVYTNP